MIDSYRRNLVSFVDQCRHHVDYSKNRCTRYSTQFIHNNNWSNIARLCSQILQLNNTNITLIIDNRTLEITLIALRRLRPVDCVYVDSHFVICTIHALQNMELIEESTVTHYERVGASFRKKLESGYLLLLHYLRL